MKIRTITTGFSYQQDMNEEDFSEISDKLHLLKNGFLNNNYQVQTIRMSTQPWHYYAKTKKELISAVQTLSQRMNNHQIDYFNIGPTEKKDCIPWLSEILQICQNVFCTAKICNKTDIDYESINEIAKIILKNAKLEPQGFTNLRFAALCNVSPNTPFYPASYHDNKDPSFALGLENSDLVYQSFKEASSLEQAKKALKQRLMYAYEPLESLAIKLSKKYKIKYNGIDLSISTSIEKQESIAYAFEHLIKDYKFGQPGTLSIAKIITDTLQSLPIKKTGYCGLMLPVLEDDGLAIRNTQNYFSITNLLLYSAVCGTGLDTIPLPGNITCSDLEHILLDVASLSIKLQKPLSARLMPIPDKKQGDQSNYSFPYFKNSAVMTQR